MLCVKLREKLHDFRIKCLRIDDLLTLCDLLDDLFRVSPLDLGDMSDFPLLLPGGPSVLGANRPITAGIRFLIITTASSLESILSAVKFGHLSSFPPINGILNVN